MAYKTLAYSGRVYSVEDDSCPQPSRSSHRQLDLLVSLDVLFLVIALVGPTSFESVAGEQRGKQLGHYSLIRPPALATYWWRKTLQQRAARFCL
jgi:hypothetical protein